jgi:hypothetical protein
MTNSHNACSAANEDADDYEKRIREKVWSSECLTAGEWVYLCGLFQTVNEYEAAHTGDVAQPPLSREAIKRAIHPFCFSGKNSDAITDAVLALASQPSPATPVETPPRAWLEAKAEVDAGWPDRCSADTEDATFEWTLPNRLRADFMHREVADWNTLVDAADEIEQLRAAQVTVHTDAKSGVMRAAENAAKTVEGWSASKREYADRVTFNLAQSVRMRVELIEQCAKIAEPWSGFMTSDKMGAMDSAIVDVRQEIANAIRALIFQPSPAATGIDLAPTEPQAAPVPFLLTVDFAQALPDGRLDDATYEKIEAALDKADAPSTKNGKWLSLHERIAALALSRPAPQAAADPICRDCGKPIDAAHILSHPRSCIVCDPEFGDPRASSGNLP